MPRLQVIQPENASAEVRPFYDELNDRFGMVPNLVRALANSPAALKGYLMLEQALEESVLPAKLREQISLTVSEVNGCPYCVAAHSAIGQAVGLSDSELIDARQATSPDSRVDAALRFTRLLVEQRGSVTDDDLNLVRRAGFGDAEIAEIVAVVAWMTLSNYLNLVAETEIDFPTAAKIVV